MESVEANSGRKLCGALDGATSFSWLMTRFTTPEKGERADVVLIIDGDDGSSIDHLAAKLAELGASIALAVECAPSAALSKVSASVARITRRNLEGSSPKLDEVFSI